MRIGELPVEVGQLAIGQLDNINKKTENRTVEQWNNGTVEQWNNRTIEQ
jgi:hypothetical protein